MSPSTGPRYSAGVRLEFARADRRRTRADA
jgi:hypothetical protein